MARSDLLAERREEVNRNLLEADTKTSLSGRPREIARNKQERLWRRTEMKTKLELTWKGNKKCVKLQCFSLHTTPQAFSRETLLRRVAWKMNSQSHFSLNRNEIERRECKCMQLHQIIGFLAGLDVVQGERWEWQQTGESSRRICPRPCFPIWPKLRTELYMHENLPRVTAFSYWSGEHLDWNKDFTVATSPW